MRDLAAERHRRCRDQTLLYAQRLARQAVQAGKVARAASLRPWRRFFDIDAESFDDVTFDSAVVASGAKPAERVRVGISIKQRGMRVPISEQRSLAAFEASTSPALRQLTHHLRSRLWGRIGHHNAARRAQRRKSRHS